jgi:hypothetical protein
MLRSKFPFVNSENFCASLRKDRLGGGSLASGGCGLLVGSRPPGFLSPSVPPKSGRLATDGLSELAHHGEAPSPFAFNLFR